MATAMGSTAMVGSIVGTALVNWCEWSVDVLVVREWLVWVRLVGLVVRGWDCDWTTGLADSDVSCVMDFDTVGLSEWSLLDFAMLVGRMVGGDVVMSDVDVKCTLKVVDRSVKCLEWSEKVAVKVG